MSQEKDKIFFRNFSIVVAILAIVMVLFVIAANIIGGIDYGDAQARDQAIAERTAPVGQVRMDGDEAPAPAAAAEEAVVADAGDEANIGKKVYEGLCISCHSAPIPGVPQIGDKEDWAPRIAQGMETLYEHSIEGFHGEGGMMMPPRGGDPNLSDEEVKAAVDYMVEKSQ